MKPICLLHTYLVASGMVLGLCLVAARAQIPMATEEFSRQNKVDVYGIGQYLHQGDAEFDSPFGTTKLHLEDTGLGGFGLAYHFNDFLAIHGDFMLGPATFKVSEPNIPSYELGDNGFIQSGRINVDYNIINRRLTPFITAGIGWQYMEVEQDYYHYDPYHHHGYYYYDYYSETDFTWNVGAGIRWNITDNLFIKVTGGAQWLTYQDARNISTQIEAFFAIGGTFP
jgi:opacity protein-like surface antigen